MARREGASCEDGVCNNLQTPATMQLKTILNLVEKHPGFVYETPRLRYGGEHAIEVPIRARRGCRPVCSGCGKKSRGYDTVPTRLYQFVPLWGIVVNFVYAPRRCDCPRCGVKIELLPWADGKSRTTLNRPGFSGGSIS
jgi:transposase